MMQLSKKVPFEDPDVLMMVRGLYIVSNVIILAINLYTQVKINQKKGMSQSERGSHALAKMTSPIQ